MFNPYFIKGKINVRRRNKKISNYPTIAQNVLLRNQRFDSFVENRFNNLSVFYMGWECLKKNAALSYDAFLCGSDQLWLPANLGSHFYTLEFVPLWKPKIAYATSFGVSSIPWYQKGEQKYLERFQALSTREVRGAHIINELTGKEVQVVCDPTLLFDAVSWAHILPVNRVVNEPYVFVIFGN